jgi:hypothetical protein
MEDESIIFFRPYTHKDRIRLQILIRLVIAMATEDNNKTNWPITGLTYIRENEILDNNNYRLSFYKHWL